MGYDDYGNWNGLNPYFPEDVDEVRDRQAERQKEREIDTFLDAQDRQAEDQKIMFEAAQEAMKELGLTPEEYDRMHSDPAIRKELRGIAKKQVRDYYATADNIRKRNTKGQFVSNSQPQAGSKVRAQRPKGEGYNNARSKVDQGQGLSDDDLIGALGDVLGSGFSL